MKIKDLPRSRTEWFISAFLRVFADIAGTLATFMPMKSVFILAADDIPSFFPEFLVLAGPLWTGVLLVILAALLGIMATWSRTAADSLAKPSELFPTSAAMDRDSLDKALPSTRINLHEFSNLVLLIVLSLAAGLISPIFTSSVIAWVSGSAIVIALMVHRTSRRPPFPDGWLEFQTKLSGWVAGAAMWASVGGAILTLVVAVPPLGLTGILLGAILLIRLQRAVPEIVPFLVQRISKKESSTTTAVSIKSPVFAPWDFVATPVGQRLLRESLERNGLDREWWEVIGQTGPAQMTMIARKAASAELCLLRIFSRNRRDLLHHELDFRQSPDSLQVLTSDKPVECSIAGLPSMLLSFPSGYLRDFRVPVAAREAIEWQLAWEFAVSSSEESQEALANISVGDPSEFLLPSLVLAANIGGPHQEVVKTVKRNFSKLTSRYLNGPRVLTVGGAASALNFIKLSNGKLEPLNLSSWTPSLPGADWTDSAVYLNVADELRSQFGNEDLIESMKFRSYVRSLSRALGSRISSRIFEKGSALVGFARWE